MRLFCSNYLLGMLFHSSLKIILTLKSWQLLFDVQVDDDAEEDEDAWADEDGAADDLANEAEEAGRTARDIEARMRKDRDRGLGFDDAMDAEAIENYYR